MSNSCASQVALVVKNAPASAEDRRDEGSVLGSWRSSGEGNGNPFQYSCLENPMDRRAWWPTVHEVAESDMSEHTHTFLCLSIILLLIDCIIVLFWAAVSQSSLSVVSDSLWPHGLQHARLPCPSPTPRPYSSSCPSCQWCHSTISCSVILLSSCLLSFPASGSFLVSRFFTSGGQSTGVSALASFLPKNT